LPAAVLVGMRHHATEGGCTLELVMQTKQPCIIELCTDMGDGYDGNDKISLTIKTWSTPESRVYSFPLKDGNCRGVSLRIIPLYGDTQVLVASAIIYGADHKPMANFTPYALRPVTEDVHTASPNNEAVVINVPANVPRASSRPLSTAHSRCVRTRADGTTSPWA